MQRIGKIDTWIIDKVQRAYLWALDWTGIFLGTIMFLLVAIQVCMLFWEEQHLIGAIVFLLGALCGYWYYHLQSAGMKDMLNARAESEITEDRNIAMRLTFIGMNLLLIVSDSLQANPRGVLFLMLNCVWWYLLCVKVRDREPKEFFKPKLATEATNG